jgi:hypothetical protein
MSWIITAEDATVAKVKRVIDEKFGGDLDAVVDAIRSLSSIDAFAGATDRIDTPIEQLMKPPSRKEEPKEFKTLPGKAFNLVDKGFKGFDDMTDQWEEEIMRTTTGKLTAAAFIVAVLAFLYGVSQDIIKANPDQYVHQAVGQQVETAPQQHQVAPQQQPAPKAPSGSQSPRIPSNGGQA